MLATTLQCDLWEGAYQIVNSRSQILILNVQLTIEKELAKNLFPRHCINWWGTEEDKILTITQAVVLLVPERLNGGKSFKIEFFQRQRSYSPNKHPNKWLTHNYKETKNVGNSKFSFDLKIKLHKLYEDVRPQK